MKLQLLVVDDGTRTETVRFPADPFPEDKRIGDGLPFSNANDWHVYINVVAYRSYAYYLLSMRH